jgi:hypothetical protein
MVRRTQRDDGGTAVIDNKPTAAPADIAARVAAADADARLREAVAAVEQWRGIVRAIASGIEPDGPTLAAVGDLGRKLRLPPDALARAVAAVQEERRLQGECDTSRSRIAAIKAREPELAAEIKAAQAKLLALNEELAEYRGLHSAYPFAAQAVAAVKQDNPLVFAGAEIVAARLIAADNAVGTATLKSMAPQEWRPEGHHTRTNWST